MVTVARQLNSSSESETAESFQGRMEAQCRRIRRYRREVIRNEGRLLSYDEAALEWIERYAEGFARDSDSAPPPSGPETGADHP